MWSLFTVSTTLTSASLYLSGLLLEIVEASVFLLGKEVPDFYIFYDPMTMTVPIPRTSLKCYNLRFYCWWWGGEIKKTYQKKRFLCIIFLCFFFPVNPLKAAGAFGQKKALVETLKQ